MADTDILLEQIAPFRWKLPIGAVPGMRVPGEIIASEDMIPRIISDRTPEQVANVAALPGIVRASIAMPDIHWGYGFPIGGVAAFDLNDGIISPGGVGYDINCGVCLVGTNLEAARIRHRIPGLIDALFDAVPCGVGSAGKVKLSKKDFDNVSTRGANWVVEQGYGWADDIERMEEHGSLGDADPSLISQRTFERAANQLGTLGSGNHFLEIQTVSEIFNKPAAEIFGLFEGQVVAMIHSGSRGCGHQICDENLKVMQSAVRRYHIELPDRQLACAPIKSSEGQDYLAMMRAAANFAWANRLTMVGLTRKVFEKYFKMSRHDLGMRLVYDVCHNIAKFEDCEVNGRRQPLCVHRKGATRAFGPGDKRLPKIYRDVGQPVIIPGDMGRASYVLVGLSGASDTTFSSSCHGAGRLMSRNAAVKKTRGEDIVRRLAKQGVTVRARGKWTLHEEVPEAYKDVSEVVDAVQGAGISQKVALLKPMGTVKG